MYKITIPLKIIMKVTHKCSRSQQYCLAVKGLDVCDVCEEVRLLSTSKLFAGGYFKSVSSLKKNGGSPDKMLTIGIIWRMFGAINFVWSKEDCGET